MLYFVFAVHLFDFNLCFQENTKDTKPCEVKTPHTPGKLAEARSVFENGAPENNISNRKDKLFPPPKPPRVAAMETNSEEIQPGEQQQPAKRRAPSPPRETKESSDTGVADHSTTSVIKRKAPEPPTSNQEESKIHPGKSDNAVEISETKCDPKDTKEKRNNPSQSSSTDEEEGCTPVPAKRERKGSVVSLDGIDKTEGDQPTPKPRRKVQNSCEANNNTQEEHGNKERKQKEEKVKGSVKRAKKTGLDNTVTIVATPVDARGSTTDKSKPRPQEQPCIIQACLVEDKLPATSSRKGSNENTVTVTAISCGGSEVKGNANRGEKVNSVSKTEKHHRKEHAAVKVSGDVIPATAMVSKPPTSRKTKESTKKDDFAFKVPRRPTRECQFDPNETINLNDVNIHEMTFTFDFGQFDQELEKDRESMFKLSYEEKCKQVGRFFSFSNILQVSFLFDFNMYSL